MITIEQINGKPHTIIDHFKEGFAQVNLDAFQWCTNGVGEMFFGGRHYATALPPLPRHPKPKDAWLLYLYAAHGLIPSGAYRTKLQRLDDGKDAGWTGWIFADVIGSHPPTLSIPPMLLWSGHRITSFHVKKHNEVKITHCLHNGSQVEVAIEGGENVAV